MTPVAWVAGIWLTALDLHLAQREVKTQQNGKKKEKKKRIKHANSPSLNQIVILRKLAEILKWQSKFVISIFYTSL